MTRPQPWPKPKRTPKRVTLRTSSKRSQKSGGSLFPKLVSQSRRSWIRTQACVATGRRSGEVVTAQAWMSPALKSLCPYRARVIAAHVGSRGHGSPDEGNMVPLDWHVHEFQHAIGWPAFEKRLRLAPRREIAAEFERRYMARASALQLPHERAPGWAEDGWPHGR